MLFPLIILFCIIGVYSVNSSVVEIWFMIVFGVVGYLLKKFEYELPPMVLALILGPMFENALRQSLIISDGSPAIFFRRPISATLLTIAILLLISNIVPWLREKKQLITDAD
jgi:putative tricarboxylic transport membrane protein